MHGCGMDYRIVQSAARAAHLSACAGLACMRACMHAHVHAHVRQGFRRGPCTPTLARQVCMGRGRRRTLMHARVRTHAPEYDWPRRLTAAARSPLLLPLRHQREHMHDMPTQAPPTHPPRGLPPHQPTSPVSLISTTQPLVSFSSRRRKEASKSRRPGLGSLARMSSMRMDLPHSVDSSRRRRKDWHPLKRSIAVVARRAASVASTSYNQSGRYNKHATLKAHQEFHPCNPTLHRPQCTAVYMRGVYVHLCGPAH